jgi:hypothetical protein
LCGRQSERFKKKLTLDIAASAQGSIVLCVHAGIGANQTIFGFGINNERSSYPGSSSVNILDPTPFTLSNSKEANSVHCGFYSCFVIEKENPKIFYSWYDEINSFEGVIII